MKRIKDFLYNWNDIIIVLCIVIIAALVIYWRVNVIMNYPLTLATSANQTAVANTDKGTTPSDPSQASDGADASGGNQVDNSGSSTSSGSSGGSDDSSPADDAIWKDGVLRSNMEVTVPSSGTAYDAIQSLVDAGLFKSFDDFALVAGEQGYDPSYIVAGTYTFEAGSSQADVVDVVMNGNSY